MSTLQFARENIVFEKQSLISGPFDESRYRFLIDPLNAADSIATKNLVVFKAAGCMGTVFLQIVIAKRIVCDTGDMYFVAQTDEDAKEWSITRGKDFILRIPDVFRLRKMSEKYWCTLGMWLFRHKFLLITGPGKNARQSKQVRYVFTDESHLEAYENGALAEFDDRRQSAGWTGQSIHATTAPDSGREAATAYLLGRQNEWHWMCPACSKLIWPLWENYSRDFYNGERVFIWKESQSENETLDSIVAICPHCQSVSKDVPRTRVALNENAAYDPQNVGAPLHTDSFRWSVFAAPWIEWRTVLAKHLAAKKAALLGDYSKAENFIKKQLCMIYSPEAVDYGESHVNLITWTPSLDTTRICSFDFQEGHGAEGIHWWGQVDEFSRNGDSMRIEFVRLESWANCRQFQLDHKAGDSHTYCDAGFRDKETFARCAMWRWYALLASDSDQFLHEITVEGKKRMVPDPYYTQTKQQNSTSGQNVKKSNKKGIRVKSRSLPEGWCLSRTWSKPNIGFMLLRLKSGRLPMVYGVPTNFNPEYAKQLNSYVETVEEVKKTGAKKRILKQVKEADHAFAVSSQNLVGAIVAGYFPVANQTEEAA